MRCSEANRPWEICLKFSRGSGKVHWPFRQMFAAPRATGDYRSAVTTDNICSNCFVSAGSKFLIYHPAVQQDIEASVRAMLMEIEILPTELLRLEASLFSSFPTHFSDGALILAFLLTGALSFSSIVPFVMGNW